MDIFRSDPPTSIPFPDNAFIRSAILPIEVVSGPEALTVDDVEDEVGLEALLRVSLHGDERGKRLTHHVRSPSSLELLSIP